MRENRPYGSEGGGAEFNQPFLPLSLIAPVAGVRIVTLGTRIVFAARSWSCSGTRRYPRATAGACDETPRR